MHKSKAVYSDIDHLSLASAPLSFQQERVLYLNKLSGDGPLWNRVSCKRLSGRLKPILVRQAVEALIERHPVLKTRINLSGGEPNQSTHPAMEGLFEHLDLSSQGPRAGERARVILDGEYQTPFQLEGGPLFRSALITCSDQECWLILKLHHIISDATSLHILWNDLKALYNGLAAGAESLPELPVDYADYCRWLREEFTDEKLEAQESYWLNRFTGELPKLDLPTDFPAPPTLSFSGAMVKKPLTPTLVKRLQSFSLDQRVIPFSTMLAAYYLLLQHYCRQDDIVIGTVFSGRHYSPKIQQLAGFFTTTVALRAQLDEVRTAAELVKYVHRLVQEAHDMQDYPFERLVGRLAPDREHQRNPLFRAMFNMVTDYRETSSFAGTTGEDWREPAISATQVDFFLDFHLKPEQPELRVEYNAEIFREATVDRMLGHFLTLLEKIVAAPDLELSELTMLDEAELTRVLSLGEGEPGAVFTRGVVELLEERAARSPEQAALLHDGMVLSSGEFNRRANRLAASLVEAGVAEGDTVAVILDRSPELVLALFAVLKVGAAYLPIDPSFPQGRIGYMLEDSGASCVLVSPETPPALKATAPGLKWLAVDQDILRSGEADNPGRATDPDRTAYLIYTSGSTGKPKGVEVTHRALMNTLDFLEAKYPLNRKTILLKTNYTFDVAATELFGWLYDGGRLAVLDKGAEKDAGRLFEAVKRYGVSHINFVPSMLDALLSDPQERDLAALEGLKYLFAAGEALKPELVSRFHGLVKGVRLENLYGPTEAAIYATRYSLPRGMESKRVPIGRPLDNTRAYILDRNLKPVPAGVIGELCVAGAGLARGYLNRPELNAERFPQDPFTAGERMYRTGDLARWSEDGLIEYLGRSDGQVKIRGFRVELGEVERRVKGCGGVAEAAVKTTTDRFGQKRLVAYLVLEQNATVETVREELEGWLPNYMIPEHFVQLDSLPRLASGKIDMQGLPEPQAATAPEPATKVQASELEQKIIAIAEELLNTRGLDPSSNFFRLGGNSLLTLRFVAALDCELGTSLSILDFLELPTIAEIAALIEENQAAQAPPQDKGEGRARYGRAPSAAHGSVYGGGA